MRGRIARAAGHHGWPAHPRPESDADGREAEPAAAREPAAPAALAACAAPTAAAASAARSTPGGTVRPDRIRGVLLAAAALLTGAACFLPLWGMTLASVQYPEGLRMVVRAGTITGDIAEINALNHYIGMAPIDAGFFPELRRLPLLLSGIAALCLVAAIVRRRWIALLPLAAMAVTAAYGLLRMRRRLYQYGHDLDPAAAIDIEPFTPKMLGESVIAQFGVYAYFGPGFWLPLVAGGLVAFVLWRDLRATRRPAAQTPPVPSSGAAAVTPGAREGGAR
ncbi:MAG TPA: hypothetical protein VF158_10915 [Longimicrobiales bacterium]